MLHIFTSETATVATVSGSVVQAEASPVGGGADGGARRPNFAAVFAEARSRQSAAPSPAIVELEPKAPGGGSKEPDMPVDEQGRDVMAEPDTGVEVARDDRPELWDDSIFPPESGRREIAKRDGTGQGDDLNTALLPAGATMSKKTDHDKSRIQGAPADAVAPLAKAAPDSGSHARATPSEPTPETKDMLRRPGRHDETAEPVPRLDRQNSRSKPEMPERVGPSEKVAAAVGEQEVSQGANTIGASLSSALAVQLEGESTADPVRAPYRAPEPGALHMSSRTEPAMPSEAERPEPSPVVAKRVAPLTENVRPRSEPSARSHSQGVGAERNAPQAQGVVTKPDSQVVHPMQTAEDETGGRQMGEMPGEPRSILKPVSVSQSPVKEHPRADHPGPQAEAGRTAIETTPPPASKVAHVIPEPSLARQTPITGKKAGEGTGRSILEPSDHPDLPRSEVSLTETRSRPPLERWVGRVFAPSPVPTGAVGGSPVVRPAGPAVAAFVHPFNAIRNGEERLFAGIETDVIRFTAAGDLTSQVETSAPLRPSAPMTSLSPDLPRHVAEQLATGYRDGGGKSAEIMLNPAELGRVRISLQTSETGVIVTVLAERPETLDLLRRHSDSLAQEFHEIGYGAAEFSFGQGGDAQAGDDSEEDRATYLPEMTASDSDAPKAAESSLPSTRIALERVDIRL